MPIKAPYLPYHKLREISYQFLSEHNPADKVPVEIEHIAEFGFGLDIVSFPGLLESFEIDSFLSRDLRSIYIDDGIYRRALHRYRFSLAHEVSHVVLHRDVLSQLSQFSTISGWNQAIEVDPNRWTVIAVG